jgi:hypothetical protein
MGGFQAALNSVDKARLISNVSVFSAYARSASALSKGGEMTVQAALTSKDLIMIFGNMVLKPAVAKIPTFMQSVRSALWTVLFTIPGKIIAFPFKLGWRATAPTSSTIKTTSPQAMP